jgi:MerR family transcriptional regulator, light-induced transcriptional regulator
MCVYSIRDIEQLSGIKAHTLRIWEQRYNFISPKRTETNIRYYSDEDLKLVLNISLLKDNGYKISKIIKMSDEQLREEALKLTEQRLAYPEQIQALTLSMIELDEARFEKIIATNILQSGFEHTMINIVFPFFHRIGTLWQTGSITPVHEHFISHLVRQKLMVAIDGQFNTANERPKKFMLFLHEDEMHELTLLFSAYVIKSRKHHVLYLGQNLPLDDMLAIYETHKPEFVLTVVTTTPNQGQIQEYVNHLAEKLKYSTVLISGLQVVGHDLSQPENVVLLNRFNDLVQFVEALDPKYSAVSPRNYSSGLSR